jgi:hypothetical protein
VKYALNILSFLKKLPIWIVLPFLLLSGNCLVGFNGLYGQDSFEYLRYARALNTSLSGGAVPGPFHWPVVYPLSGALVSFVLPDVFSLQLLSVICYGLTIFFLIQILRYISPERKSESLLYVFLFFALSPFILLYSSAVMSDSMAICLLSAFFYFFFRFLKEEKNMHFLTLIFLSFVLINIRLASGVVLLVPLTIATLHFLKSFQFRKFIFVLLLISVVFILSIYILNKWNPQFYRQLMVPDWSVKYLFQRSFLTENGTFNYRFPNICLVAVNLLHPGFIFAGFILLLKSRQVVLLKSPFIIPGVVLLFYSLFIAGLPTQNYRFLLLTFPLVILFYSGAFYSLFDMMKGFRPILYHSIIGAIILIQLLLSYHVFKPFYHNSVNTKEIAYRMKKFPGKTIYTFNIDMALKAYGVSNPTINLWESKINNFEQGSLVLFNYIDSYDQWKGTNPILNWESLQKMNELKLIDSLPGNWNLYEIGN